MGGRAYSNDDKAEVTTHGWEMCIIMRDLPLARRVTVAARQRHPTLRVSSSTSISMSRYSIIITLMKALLHKYLSIKLLLFLISICFLPAWTRRHNWLIMHSNGIERVGRTDGYLCMHVWEAGTRKARLIQLIPNYWHVHSHNDECDGLEH